MNSSIETFVRYVHRIVIVVLVFMTTQGVANAQTAARPDRGIMPGASYSVSETENISLTNGNLNLSIPPMAGGKLKFGLSAIYNSKLWNVTRHEHRLTPIDGCGDWIVSTPQLSD